LHIHHFGSPHVWVTHIYTRCLGCQLVVHAFWIGWITFGWLYVWTLCHTVGFGWLDVRSLAPTRCHIPLDCYTQFPTCSLVPAPGLPQVPPGWLHVARLDPLRWVEFTPWIALYGLPTPHLPVRLVVDLAFGCLVLALAVLCPCARLLPRYLYPHPFTPRCPLCRCPLRYVTHFRLRWVIAVDYSLVVALLLFRYPLNPCPFVVWSCGAPLPVALWIPTHPIHTHSCTFPLLGCPVGPHTHALLV